MFILPTNFDKEVDEKKIVFAELEIDTKIIINYINKKLCEYFSQGNNSKNIYFADLYYFIKESFPSYYLKYCLKIEEIETDKIYIECFDYINKKVFSLFEEKGWKIEIYDYDKKLNKSIKVNKMMSINNCFFRFMKNDEDINKKNGIVNKFEFLDI